MRLLLKNAQVVAVGGGPDGKVGKEMDDVLVLPAHSILVADDGRIHKICPAAEMDVFVAELAEAVDATVDCTNKCVLPGFVDAHTHAVFSGDRSHEMKMKLAGATYVDVHKAGGGINFTVRSVRAASEAELEALLEERLDRMLACGTTTAEVKSGYGLDTATEMKMLRVITNVNKRHPVRLEATFCGAHSVPEGHTAESMTEDVVAGQLPELVRLRDAGDIAVSNVDVFCEEGFFDADQSRRILEAGKAAGLAINFHGDELNPMGSGELGAAVGARAISHLEHVDDAGIAAMAGAHVFGVLLPTTAYVLRIAPPPARKLIDGGVPVALGSDFNPNAHCLSMPFVMNLACVTMRMTMTEALVAATINSAAALNVGHMCGSLQEGKLGDCTVFDVPSWEHVVYQMGDGAPVAAVYKEGVAVYPKRP